MKNLKFNLLLLLLPSLIFFSACSQERVSPAKSVTQKVGDATITIDYSSPSVKGRVIWGELVPYNEVWRTGANEATVFSTDKDITINGEKLVAGKYALFTIPTKKDWTIIFNKTHEQWGAFDYDKTKDALRIDVKVDQEKENTEALTIDIERKGEVEIKWEKLEIDFKIKS